jgi:uncharacterized protein
MRKVICSLLGAAFLLSCAGFISGQRQMTIAEIQGDKSKSPVENQSVKTTGIVTARNRNGYFIQSPDDKTDNNPATSEGLYVFVGQNDSFSGSIGDLVEVTGTVAEYIPRNERFGFTNTQLTRTSVRNLSSKNTLPAPITLTTADLVPTNLASLEKFEGMRVRADSLAVTAPTGGNAPDERNKYQGSSDGVFFATLAGVARPMREPGLDVFIHQALKPAASIQWFDTNPEMIRVDTDAQTGSKPIVVTAGATVRNVVGVMDYAWRRYTILVDASTQPAVEGNRTFTPVPPAGEREISVTAFNIQNLFDDERNSDNVQDEAVVPKEFFQKRLAKASLAIRNALSLPDVLGLEEVENLKVLKKLATKVNADAVAAGLPDPKYEAYLEDGNDPRGIDSGYLIKTTRVKVLEAKQLAKDQPLAVGGGNLYDRPPYLIRVQAIDPKSTDPLALTVIINHFKSYGGIDDAKDGNRVQVKRAEQANWLANFIAERAKTNPDERVAVCGDFNAFVVNDGYNDLIGTLIGDPAQNVLVPGKTYATNLIDLALLKSLPQAERYSYVFDGSAQVLDHMLINKKMGERFVKFAYARFNADFPVAWGNDDARVERLSDHDPPVLYLSLDAKKAAGPPKPTATP